MQRILCLGDSYTGGTGVEAAESWPWRLTVRLRARGVEVHDPVILARTGWTAGELEEAIQLTSPAGPFDLVTVMAGVNDQYRGHLPEDFRGVMRRLLARAAALSRRGPEGVLVPSIPDWGVTPFAAERDRLAIRVAIDDFNAVVLEEAEAAGTAWIDLTTISRLAADDLSLVAEDGLHPSAALHERWVEAILPAAEAVLRGSPR